MSISLPEAPADDVIEHASAAAVNYAATTRSNPFKPAGDLPALTFSSAIPEPSTFDGIDVPATVTNALSHLRRLLERQAAAERDAATKLAELRAVKEQAVEVASAVLADETATSKALDAAQRDAADSRDALAEAVVAAADQWESFRLAILAAARSYFAEVMHHASRMASSAEDFGLAAAERYREAVAALDAAAADVDRAVRLSAYPAGMLAHAVEVPGVAPFTSYGGGARSLQQNKLMAHALLDRDRMHELLGSFGDSLVEYFSLPALPTVNTDADGEESVAA
jgi:hypothetical protein